MSNGRIGSSGAQDAVAGAGSWRFDQLTPACGGLVPLERPRSGSRSRPPDGSSRCRTSWRLS